MKTETFNLIGSTTHYDTKSKLHVAKEQNDINTMCGIHPGFEYEIISINGAANEADNRLFTKHYILSLTSLCKRCAAVIAKYDMFGNAAPIPTNGIGEWWFNGCFIQEQRHPKLMPFISFKDDNESHIITTHHTFKEAVKYVLKNGCENPKTSPKDWL